MTNSAGRRDLDVVLFDFDHTLAHFGDHVAWDEARAAVLPLYRAAGIPQAFLEATPGELVLYERVGASGLLPANQILEVQRAASMVLARFEAEGVAETELLPGTRELLNAIADLGVRTAIVTSNSAAVVEVVLEREGLRSRFEAVIGRSEVAALKPSPEGILAACAALEVAPSACAYLGDTDHDMQAAHAAGVRAWGLETSWCNADQLRAAGANEVFANLDDVRRHLEDMQPAAAREGEAVA